MSISERLRIRFLKRLHDKYRAFQEKDVPYYFSDFTGLLDLMERYFQTNTEIRRESFRERLMPFIQTGMVDDDETGKPKPLSPFVTAFPGEKLVRFKDKKDKKWRVKPKQMLPALRIEALDRFLDAVVDASIESIEDVREAEKLESVLDAQSVPAPKAESAPKPRLELVEGRKQFRIDNKWHDYTGERASYLLAMLMNAKGEWEPGSNLVSDERSRADRTIKHLPEPIRNIIESRRGGTGGYRIKPEYFQLT